MAGRRPSCRAKDVRRHGELLADLDRAAGRTDERHPESRILPLGEFAYEPTTALRNATDAERERGASALGAAGQLGRHTQLSGELGTQIADLKAEPGKDLLAHGGASFAQSLVRLGLVDEYRLLVHPTVLGSGMALFDGATPFDLKLVDSTIFASGIHALVYHPICHAALP